MSDCVMRKAYNFIGRYFGDRTEDIAAVSAACAAEIARAAAAEGTGGCLTEAGYKLYAALAYRGKYARETTARKAAAGGKYGNCFADMTAKAVNDIVVIHI